MMNQSRKIFSFLVFVLFLHHSAFGIADTSLIGYWPMDEVSGSIVADVSGNGLDATLSNINEATHINGKLNNALNFDGTRDGTIVSANALKPESLTIAAYINIMSASGTWQWVGGHGDNYGLVVNRNGDIHFYYYNGLSWPKITIDVDDLRDGQWHLLQVVLMPLLDSYRHLLMVFSLEAEVEVAILFIVKAMIFISAA